MPKSLRELPADGADPGSAVAVLTHDAATAPSEVAPDRLKGPRLQPGAVAAVVGIACLLVGVLSGNPSFVLFGLVAALTAILTPWFPIDLAVPTAVVCLVLSSIVAGISASVAEVDLLSRPWALVAVYSACSVLAPVVARRARLHASPLTGSAWLAMLPAGACTAVSVVQALSVDVARSWAFSGTDIANHMIVISHLQRDGALDYSQSAYPKGLHMLAALVSTPGAPLENPGDLLGYDLRLTASLAWAALALLLWTSASLALRLAELLGLPRGIPVLAALLLGAGALLTNTFIVMFVYLGAAASLLAVVAMWLLPVALLARVRGVARLPVLVGVTCCLVLVLAHLWQVLAVVPVAGLAFLAIPRISSVMRGVRSGRIWRPVLLLLPVVGVTALLATVPVFLIHEQGGSAMAALPADVPAGPWKLLLPALACLPLLFRQFRTDGVRLIVGSAFGLFGTTALLLYWAGQGFDLTQYYPMKSLWFLTLFMAPILALAVAWTCLAVGVRVWRWLGRVPRVALALRATVFGTTAAVAFAIWLPWLIGPGSATTGALRAVEDTHGVLGPASTRSAQRYDIAARYGSANRPAVVFPYFVGSSAVFDRYGTRITSLLLAFQTGQPEMGGDPADICRELRRVAGTRDAVVISRMPSDRVQREMTDDGCPGLARVVHVPGGIDDLPPSGTGLRRAEAVAVRAARSPAGASASGRAAGSAGR
jgi:hypothetical protein